MFRVKLVEKGLPASDEDQIKSQERFKRSLEIYAADKFQEIVTFIRFVLSFLTLFNVIGRTFTYFQATPIKERGGGFPIHYNTLTPVSEQQ